MKDQFFKGLKVVELASVLAGPAVGLFFSELGADVTKIENKTTGGDVTRKWKLPSEETTSEYSAYFCSVNWNKSSLFLDLRSTNDQIEALDLIKEADIVISNFKMSSAEKLGMSYEQLKEINPELIYGQITAYGSNDPTPAFDVVLQAETGFLYMNGEPGRPPVKMPVALIDLLAAHQLKEGILVALIHKMRTGEGSLVTASLFDAAIASLANQATNWLMGGHIPQKMGTQHPNIAPYGDVFLSKDNKPVLLAVGTDRQFQSCCSCLNVSSLSIDPQFKTNEQRVKNRVLLKEKLAPAVAQFEAQPILKKLKENNVPCGSINTMKEVFELENAKAQILEEKMPDGKVSARARSVVFNIYS